MFSEDSRFKSSSKIRAMELWKLILSVTRPAEFGAHRGRKEWDSDFIPNGRLDNYDCQILYWMMKEKAEGNWKELIRKLEIIDFLIGNDGLNWKSRKLMRKSRLGRIWFRMPLVELDYAVLGLGRIWFRMP